MLAYPSLAIRGKMPEPDVVKPLEQAIEEFHKLREDSRRLLHGSIWPDVKPPAATVPVQDEAPVLEVPVLQEAIAPGMPG